MITDYPHMPLLPRQMVNYYDIKRDATTIFHWTDEDIAKFNEVFNWRKSIYPGEWTRITRTPSGGISVAKGKLYYPAYDIIKLGGLNIELLILCESGMYRFVMCAHDKKTGITGSRAFAVFKSICKDHGIDISDFAVENGKEIKATIESPMRQMTHECKMMRMYGIGKDLPNCHHLDLNNSYLSGIALKFPALQPPIADIIKRRREDPAHEEIYKAILTHSYGYFQSQYCVINHHGYALAHLSKTAIDYNNAYIKMLLKKLRESGRTPLLINTDGIWYHGDLYHDANEGPHLGQWKHDYVDCVLNIKSDAAYQFEGTDVKHSKKIRRSVMSGLSNYDRIEPDRTKWEWNTIYKQCINLYYFDEERGICCVDSKDT